MSSAETILANELGDARLTVDLYSRTISIPASIKHLGVESDDEVHRLPFSMPRYYGEFDLSEFKVRINYVNAKGEGDVHEPEDVEIGDNDITFSWLVGRHAFTKVGTVEFNVCLKKYSEENSLIVAKEFNTTPTSLSVLKGLEITEYITSNNLDLLEQWRKEVMDTIEDHVPSGVLYYKNSALYLPVEGSEWADASYGGPLSDQKFVAIKANSDVAMYSVDGFNWHETKLPVAMGWKSVASSYKGHVAVAWGTTESLSYHNIAVYSRDGINWEQITLPSSTQWWSITSAGGGFVAVGSSGRVAYSNDGRTWTSVSVQVGGYEWLAVGCGEVYNVDDEEDHYRYVMLDANNPVGAYSDDGINWTACNTTNLVQYGSWRNMVFGNDKFVAMDTSGRITYSSDGINWSAPSYISQGTAFERLHVSNAVYPAVFIATSRYDDSYAYSTDAVNWTVVEREYAKNWTAMVNGLGHTFALTSLYGSNLYYTDDGINWSNQLKGIFRNGNIDKTEEIRELVGGGSGGGSVKVDVDTTLSISGAAADSATVGNRLSTVAATANQALTTANTAKSDAEMVELLMATNNALKSDGMFRSDNDVCVQTSDGDDTLLMGFKYVTDELPLGLMTMLDKITLIAILSFGGIMQPFPTSFDVSMADAGIITACDGMVAFVMKDNAASGDLIFPKRGVYMMAYSFIVNQNQSIPEFTSEIPAMYVSAVVFMDMSDTESMTAIGIPDNRPKFGSSYNYSHSVEFNSSPDYPVVQFPYTISGSSTSRNINPSSRISSSVPTVEELSQGYSMTIEMYRNGVCTDVDTVVVTAEDIASDSSLVRTTSEGYILLKSGYVIIVPNPFVTASGLAVLPGIYVTNLVGLGLIDAYVSKLTISGSILRNEVPGIVDQRYLPESLHFGEVSVTAPVSTLNGSGAIYDSDLCVNIPDYIVGSDIYASTAILMSEDVTGITSGMTATVHSMIDGTANVDTVTITTDGGSDKVLIAGPSVAIVLADRVDAGNGVVFPKKGIYFIIMTKNSNLHSYVYEFSIADYTFNAKKTYIKPISQKYLPSSVDSVVINSSTSGSNKKFRITVDDSGAIKATEVT